MSLPLAEKTIVITRPREQAAELKFEFERLGARVYLFPTIEIVPPESFRELDQAILNLSVYDWLVFTSRNAVAFFINRLTVNQVEIAELDYLRVCAIGEATFDALRNSQVHVDILPEQASAENIFAALCEYLGSADELKDLRFLLPRSAIARNFLPETLRAAGASVDPVTAYQTVLPSNPETGKIKALLGGGAIDCVTFTSPSTFNNFARIIGDELPTLLQNAAIACLGETTANAVRACGLPIAVTSPAQKAQDFAAAVAAFYQ